MTNPIKLGSRGKPEETKRDILTAAIQEFANLGVAGARTDSIAQAAGVNKALLYYYFGDKEKLYGSVLEAVFSGLSGELLEVLRGPGTSGEKVFLYSLTHFDYIVSHREYGRLVQHEMMRAQTGNSEHIEPMVHRFFRPLLQEVMAVFADGVKAGEFRKIDPLQFIVSMTGLNVFFFVSIPIQKAMGNPDPFAADCLNARRSAVLDMLASTLMVDASHGRELAKKVLAAWHPKHETAKQKTTDNAVSRKVTRR